MKVAQSAAQTKARRMLSAKRLTAAPQNRGDVVRRIEKLRGRPFGELHEGFRG